MLVSLFDFTKPCLWHHLFVDNGAFICKALLNRNESALSVFHTRIAHIQWKHIFEFCDLPLNIELVERVVKLFALTPNPADAFLFSDEALPVLAAEGDLAACQWMLKYFSPARKDTLRAFLAAAHDGQLRVCQCLLQHCLNTSGKMYSHDWYYDALFYATESGHLSVCQWLVHQFGDSKQSRAVCESEEARKNAVYLMRSLASHLGDNTVIEEIYLHSVPQHIREILKCAHEQGHQSVCRWLAQHFKR